MIAAMAFATKAILAFWGASKAVDKEENGMSKTNATTEKLIITPNNKLLHNLQKNGNGIIFCRLPQNYAVLELLYFISTKFKNIKFEKSVYLTRLGVIIID